MLASQNTTQTKAVQYQIRAIYWRDAVLHCDLALALDGPAHKLIMECNSESHHMFCDILEHEPGDNLLGLIGMQVTLHSDNHKRSQVFNNDQDVLFALRGR